MLAFKQILFPVDFLESSNQAAQYVASIARTFRSNVTVLHGLDISLLVTGALLLRPEAQVSYEDLFRERREADLARFCALSI